jgi:cytochrome c553
MQAHFKDALLIREAVIAGKSEEAANPATVIANTQNLEDLPKGWREFVEPMQRTARRVSDGTSAPAVAAAAADLGVSCGACHQKHGGPKASTEPAPKAGSTLEERMKHHIWATERLWEGLAIPSNDAWNLGAQALSSDPFPPESLKPGGVDARGAAQDFVKLAKKAGSKKSAQERAALYAELLLTCGTCHQAMNEER